MRGSLFTVIIGLNSGFVNHKNIVKVRLIIQDVLFLFRFTVKRILPVVPNRRCPQHMIEPILFPPLFGRVPQSPGAEEKQHTPCKKGKA